MSHYKDLKILIVDDLHENIVALSAVLKQEKYNVLSAKSGQEALQLLSQHEVGLILMDVQMPVMSGIEAVQKIKENPATENIPVIFLTANADHPELKLKGHQIGAYEYLIKPLDLDLLLLKVSNLLNLSFVQRNLILSNEKLKAFAENSELLYENLFYSSPDEILLLDDSGVIGKINRSGKLSMGVYASELIGRHISNLPFDVTITSGMHPEHLNTETERNISGKSISPELLFEVIMKNGIKGQITDCNLTNGGEIFYYEITGTLIHNSKLDRILQVNIRDISERKKAQLQLQNSEENFRKITENTTEMIHVLFPDGTIDWVNRAWKKNLGYSDHEVIGKNISQFITSESLESFKKDSVGIKPGETKQLLRVFIAKSGEPVYVEGNATLLGENGKVSKIQSFLRNITSEVLTEKKLIVNNRRLNQAQQIAKIGSWELDLKTNVLTWSDEAYRIFDINPTEFGASYEAFLNVIHPDDREKVNEAYTNSLKTKLHYKITHRIRYNDGTIKHVEEQCKTFYDADGSPIKSIGTVQDITDKVIAEEKIIASENRFNLAMQGANDGLWDWDLVEDKLYFSPRWKSMIGYEDNELEDTFATWLTLLHPEDIEKSKQLLNNYLFGNATEYQSEFRMRHKAGYYVDILSRGRGIKDDEGNVVRMVGTHTDITERKKNEKFLNLINAGINVKTGASFFNEFTSFCCNKLDVKSAFIGKYVEGENSVETISFCINGQQQQNFKYNLENTPCDRVIKVANCFYPDKVQELFPKDENLKILNVISYYGIPLTDETNNVLGIMVLLDEKPMLNFADNQKVIAHLVPRVANELSRSLTENKLIVSETFTKGILDSLNSHIAVVDNDGIILQTNNAWNVFSLNNGEVQLINTGIGANYFDVCKQSALAGDDVAAKVLQGMQDVLAKKIPQFQIEYPCHAPDKERWFVLTVTNYLDNVPKIVVRHVDITERRKTENKIKLDSQILSGINDTVIFSDLDLNVIEWNNNAEILYGYTKEEMKGKHFPEVLHFKFMNGLSLEKMFVQLVREGEFKNEIEAETSDKRKLYISVNTSVLKNTNDIPIGIVSIHRDITDRIIQEKALELSELNYKELFEQSPFGIITLDVQGRIQSVNTKTSELTGYSKYKFIGKHYLKSPFYARPINVETGDILEKTMLSGTDGFIFETIGQTADSRKIHCEVNAKFIPEIQKITLIVRDVTGIKYTEKFNALLYNITSFANNTSVTIENFAYFLKAQLAQYFHTDNFCITSYNHHLNELEFLFFNDGERTNEDRLAPRRNSNALTEYVILNKKPLLLNKSNIKQFIKENDIKSIGPETKCWMAVPMIAESLAVGAIAVQSYSNDHTYTNDNLDLLIKIAGIITPIIEKLKNDQKLMLIDSAVASAGDGIFIIDAKQTNKPIIFANSKFFEQNGYAQDELYGLSSNMLFGNKTNIGALKAIENTLNSDAIFHDELIMYTKGKNEMWCDLQINPVIGVNGNIINYIGIQKDITQRKSMERMLIEKNKELELFMYRASHDLKGPLSTSKGLVNLALDECRDDNITNYLNLLNKSNSKLENILADLMEIVVIREGMIEKTDVDVSALIKETLDAKETEQYLNDQIKLIFDIEVKGKVKTDVKLMKIILRNLYNNAIKYSKPEFKSAYISTSAKIKNNKLELIISDNGIGIDAKLKSKVFNMFFRATEKSTGTGLGLYITKNAVDKLNGSIDIESKENSGTSVTLKIPV